MPNPLLNHVRPWIDHQLGYPLPNSPGTTPTLAPAPTYERAHPFYAVRIDNIIAASARPEWLDDIRTLFNDLHPDLLFSIAGAYELSRVTLPDDVSVWGPIPCYVADESTWRPVDDDRPEPLTAEQLEEIDWKTFWHCAGPDALAHFGIYEDDQLVALSSVVDHGHNIWEIGVDAAPESKGRGLGTAVVSAAGNWILENGAVPFASAADWNIPSGRNLRRLGLRYTYSVMLGMQRPFHVPPQPLGEPLPGTPMYDQYPRWAMNKNIRERPD